MEYQLERSGREISKRSALENPSKRSDAALNIDMQDGETDDEYNQVLDEQPDLDKVFENKKDEEGRLGLGGKVLEGFIKQWGHKLQQPEVTVNDVDREKKSSGEISAATSLQKDIFFSDKDDIASLKHGTKSVQNANQRLKI